MPSAGAFNELSQLRLRKPIQPACQSVPVVVHAVPLELMHKVTQTLRLTASLRARKTLPVLTKLEVECDRLDQVREAVAANVDVIMLDNMSVPDMAEAVKLVAGRAKLEASGGIRMETIRPIAETGVDYISTSRPQQSAPAVDIGLDES